ncbi:uncharacterized protein LOC141632488 [Silene latifolia]|uniref:uncharacterized protein LOC141632488 n=1 Tax=Silene latifolia TaxID=37657 RepID=UPI003D785D62
MEKDTLIIVQKNRKFFTKMFKFTGGLLLLGYAWWTFPIEDMCIPKSILDARKKRVEERRERREKEAEEWRELNRKVELKRVYDEYKKKEEKEKNVWPEKEMVEYIEKRRAMEAEAKAARAKENEN